MGRKLIGTLYTRGSKKAFYLKYKLNGKLFQQSLKDEKGKPIYSKRKAEKARDMLLAPLSSKDDVQRQRMMVDALKTTTDKVKDAEQLAKGRMLLSESWQIYLKHARPQVSERTLKTNKSFWTRFIEWSDKSHLDEITKDDADNYRLYLLEDLGLGNNTFNKHFTLLKRVFYFLAQRESIKQNPFKHIERRKQIANSKQNLSLEKVHEVYQLADGEYKMLILIALYTGQRLGDCCKLRWENIDLVKRQITFNPIKTRTKKKNNTIHIPMFELLFDKLCSVPSSQRRGPLLSKLYHKHDTDPSHITESIQKLFKRADIEVYQAGTGKGTGKRAVLQYGFHSLRHSFVTLCLNANIPISTVQYFVGHESTAVTQIYTHVGLEQTQNAIASLPSIEAQDKCGLSDINNQLAERVRSLTKTQSEAVMSFIENGFK